MTVKAKKPAKPVFRTGIVRAAANRKGDLYIRGANPESVAILKDSAAARRRTLNDELHARVMFVQRVRGLVDTGNWSGTLRKNISMLLSEFGLGPLKV